MTQCILNDRNRNGCNACPPHCQHRLALNGYNGKGGRIALANAPSDYRHLTLANSPARKSQAEVYELLAKYTATFSRMFDAEGERIKSLYLFSANTGTGKTTSAVAVMNEYIIANYLGALKNGQQPLQQPAYFLDVNEWQTLYNGFSRGNIPQDIAEQYSRPYYEMMEKAKHAPFAVLDDIGVRKATTGFAGDLHTIINHRTANGMPTIYTSNIPLSSDVPVEKRVEALKPYDILDMFGPRLYDRVRDQCAVIPFEGESKRGKRK